MKIEDKLVASVISGLKALYGQEVPEKMVQLQKTKKEFEGHLTLSKSSRCAETIGEPSSSSHTPAQSS